MKDKRLTRREMREKVFAGLFQADFRKDEELNDLMNSIVTDADIKPDEYFHSVFNGVIFSKKELDSHISTHLRGYKINRLSLVTLTAMRISVYEMSKLDIPRSISINEAVEIIKKYDDLKSAKYANGVLNSIANDLVLN